MLYFEIIMSISRSLKHYKHSHSLASVSGSEYSEKLVPSFEYKQSMKGIVPSFPQKDGSLNVFWNVK